MVHSRPWTGSPESTRLLLLSCFSVSDALSTYKDVYVHEDDEDVMEHEAEIMHDVDL